MSKYIIEIPDGTPYVLLRREEFGITKVVPVSELEELNSDYINEHFGELQDEAYKRGLSDVSASGYRRQYEDGYRRGYKNGRNIGIKDGMCDAWEAARKIIHMPEGDLLNIFTECYSAVCTALQVLLKYDASEAIAKLKAYEDKQKDRIEVGDEVEWEGENFTVLRVFTPKGCYEQCDGFDSEGNGYTNILTKDVHKTGRHFDIASILEAMRE